MGSECEGRHGDAVCTEATSSSEKIMFHYTMACQFGGAGEVLIDVFVCLGSHFSSSKKASAVARRNGRIPSLPLRGQFVAKQKFFPSRENVGGRPWGFPLCDSINGSRSIMPGETGSVGVQPLPPPERKVLTCCREAGGRSVKTRSKAQQCIYWVRIQAKSGNLCKL